VSEDLAPVKLDVGGLMKKLEKKFPEYDFSKPPKPDRRCKITEKDECPVDIFEKNQSYKLLDIDGELVCGVRYKLQDKDNPYKYEERTCMAVLRTEAERQVYEQKGFFK
tara:strand:+ start:200 stop:526 length:327 start_codon:yes stop_codon:yes gene_type:complete